MSTDIILSPAPELKQPALFTPTPKAAKRVLEFFTAQINNDHTRKAVSASHTSMIDNDTSTIENAASD